MTSEPGKQTIAKYIWPNISRSKGNQTMKFGELIEYSMRKSFLEKSCIKYGGETLPRLFSKKAELGISLDHWSKKVLCSLFLLYAKVRAIKIYWNYAGDHLLLPHIKHLFFKKEFLEVVFLPRFLHDSWKKCFSFYILTDHISLSGCCYFVRYWATCVL